MTSRKCAVNGTLVDPILVAIERISWKNEMF